VRSGVYWVPPQRVDAVRKFGGLLADVGIDLVICEIEAEAETIVHHVASASLDDQIAQLEDEVQQFDVKTKPSTLSRRLDLFTQLKQRALLYRDALGVGVDRAQSALVDLEQKVGAMLELRQNTVVHRDGTTSPIPATNACEPTAPAKNADEPTHHDAPSPQTASKQHPTSVAQSTPPILRFANSHFILAEEDR